MFLLTHTQFANEFMSNSKSILLLLALPHCAPKVSSYYNPPSAYKKGIPFYVKWIPTLQEKERCAYLWENPDLGLSGMIGY